MSSMRNEIKIRATIVRNYLRNSKVNESIKWKKALNFYSKLIPEGSLVFDVGANIGNRVELFLKLKTHVVAFEPQSYCARYLEVKFGKNINLEKTALGETVGTGEIHISNSSTISSMSKSWIEKVKTDRFSSFIWKKKETISVNTLDNMIKKYGVPKFCKIDVEGYEFEVLKGLNQKIKLLSIEYTVPETLDSTVACINKLKELGDIECNYSNGESFEFGLSHWIKPEEMLNKLQNDFQNNNNTEGDIYIQFIN